MKGNKVIMMNVADGFLAPNSVPQALDTLLSYGPKWKVVDMPHLAQATIGTDPKSPIRGSMGRGFNTTTCDFNGKVNGNDVYAVTHGDVKNLYTLFKAQEAGGHKPYDSTFNISEKEFQKIVKGRGVLTPDQIKDESFVVPEGPYTVVGYLDSMNVLPQAQGEMCPLDELKQDDLFTMRIGSGKLAEAFLDDLPVEGSPWEKVHRCLGPLFWVYGNHFASGHQDSLDTSKPSGGILSYDNAFGLSRSGLTSGCLGHAHGRFAAIGDLNDLSNKARNKIKAEYTPNKTVEYGSVEFLPITLRE